MGFFKKLFGGFKEDNKSKENENERQKEVENLSFDEFFVEKFIEKGGKFLYCTSIDEVVDNLKMIVKENAYDNLLCYDHDLLNITKKIDVKTNSVFSKEMPFFTSCEYLLGKQGDIMFSSNQLGVNKLVEFSKDFIVYATTSQIVKDRREGMTGINVNYKGNIPTNISSISCYNLEKTNENFMNYENSNSKKLYLILFEDL